jgi:hypothetical protein
MPGKTLDELEGVVWGEPPYDSYLLTTCHRLRAKPIDEFSVEDLRIMISQQIGLRPLMPLAIAVLEEDPLAEGDYYPGDLLSMVISNEDWLNLHMEWLGRVIRVAEQALTSARLDESDCDLPKWLAEFLARVRDG